LNGHLMEKDRDPGLRTSVPAQPSQLRKVRRLVAGFATQAGANASQVEVITLAVHEACASIARHEDSSGRRELHLQAAPQGDYVQFVVSDNGTPAADPHAGPGAELALQAMRDLADDCDIEGPGPYGTRIRLTFSLRSGNVEHRELPDCPSLP
jgi:anti-sigma regulatory factor (Ser/Thr protein kinase)